MFSARGRQRPNLLLFAVLFSRLTIFSDFTKKVDFHLKRARIRSFSRKAGKLCPAQGIWVKILILFAKFSYYLLKSTFAVKSVMLVKILFLAKMRGFHENEWFSWILPPKTLIFHYTYCYFQLRPFWRDFLWKLWKIMFYIENYFSWKSENPGFCRKSSEIPRPRQKHQYS